MAKEKSEVPASWCSYCGQYVVSCPHSGGRPPIHKRKPEPKGRTAKAAASKAKKTKNKTKK